MGSEERKFDKAWIHEISPSRTEVRVLPVIDEQTGHPNSDLDIRYNTFTSGEDFAADVLQFLDEFSAQFDITAVLNAAPVSEAFDASAQTLTVVKDWPTKALHDKHQAFVEQIDWSTVTPLVATVLTSGVEV